MALGKAYHRYFEGYSERKVWDSEKQKFRMETYYSGDYYRALLSPDEKIRIKREYIAGYVCAVIVFFFVGTRRTASAASAITAFPTLATLLGLMWQLPSLVTYCRMKELLVLREYRERKNFLSLCMGLVCCFGVSAAAHLVCIAMYQGYGDWQEWLTAAGLLLDAGIFYWIYRREKGVTYRIVPNEAKIPDDCYDITLREK